MSLKEKVSEIFTEKLEDAIGEYMSEEVDVFMKEAVSLKIHSKVTHKKYKKDDFIIYPFVHEFDTHLNPTKAIHDPKKVYLFDMFDKLIEDCEGNTDDLAAIQERWKLVKQRISLLINEAVHSAKADEDE